MNILTYSAVVTARIALNDLDLSVVDKCIEGSKHSVWKGRGRLGSLSPDRREVVKVIEKARKAQKQGVIIELEREGTITLMQMVEWNSRGFDEAEREIAEAIVERLRVAVWVLTNEAKRAIK
jgi:hypothetical protein